ncbi:hypothetical protein FHW36_1011609 [Chitinophaga polysaccharea]|uniref:TIGR04222 domain-containing membrane protein n=1 Tax=Chitinophaga polysaccharea TaxID=1293035 RepID=A0A561Q5N8_9BACT|nr:hypothetical protein [Chitinophaga polysaccharea]TWF45678.1 hypothetical protein FHW36_1011609 [Chitinophaga polysaccharea]
MKTQTSFAALSAPLLWQQISAFRLDDPKAVLPFSRKLAREQRWDQAFTQRAIQEYKRFIYLCCISPGGASPSAIVDKVWHQHLLYTENYWVAFCEQTLGRYIHHHPSSGGLAERKRHEAWQAGTWEQYRRCFGEDPPAAFWLDEKVSFPSSVLATLTRLFRPGLTFLLFFFLLLLFPACNGASPTNLVLFGLLVFWAVKTATSKPGKSSNDTSGSSCSSACGGDSSGCSSGCGGGCGSGCGGCSGS